MKEIYLTVSVDVDNDYVGEVDIEVQMEDEMFESLAALAAEYNDKGEELTEDDFQQRLPEIYKYLSEYVDNIMPCEIELQEGEEIDDYSWYIAYPYDICELFDEEDDQ